MRTALVGLALGLLACGSRAASPLQGGESPEARIQRDDGPTAGRDLRLAVGDGLGSFCSGQPRLALNGEALVVQEIKANQYMSAANAEGADVTITGSSASGQRWEVRATVMVQGWKSTITDKPFPNTVPIGPPAGLGSHVHMYSPPLCYTGGGTCPVSSLLWTESDVFSGYITLKGKDYRAPCEMELCLSARLGSTRPHLVQAAIIHVPAVTIPYWRIPGF